MTGSSGQSVRFLSWYFIDDVVSVGGESQDVTVRVGGRDRVEEKVKEPKDQGAGWFIVWLLTPLRMIQELG